MYHYEWEDKIVWLKDRKTLASLGPVQEIVQQFSIRTGPVRPPRGEQLIGYAVLKKEAIREEAGFCRRIFTRPATEESWARGAGLLGLPDAVDPLSVRAGRPSKRLPASCDQ